MKIKLLGNIELSPIMATGTPKYIQGATRDTLSFIFPSTEDMTTLDAAFTAENCETITIIGDDGTENIHKGYTIRAELTKASVEVTRATKSEDAVFEDRITISMSQRTYVESQLACLTDTVDTLVMEALM